MRHSRRYRTYRRESRRRRYAGRFIAAVFVLFAVYFVTDSLFLRAYVVTSTSMVPTLSPGDRVFVMPILYGARLPFGLGKLPGLTRPRRGDVVVARPVYHSRTAWQEVASPFVDFFTLHRRSVGDTTDPAYTFRAGVKRIAAVPGDLVKVEGNIAMVKTPRAEGFVDEFAASYADYDVTLPDYPAGWNAGLPFSGAVPEVGLGPREYYLMGDNRGSASDSRYGGPVDESFIVGRIVLRFWPFRTFGTP